MSRRTLRILAAAIGTLAACLLGEAAYRLLRGSREPARMYFRDGAGVPFWPSNSTMEQKLAFFTKVLTPIPPAGSVDWFGEGYAMPRPVLEKNTTWLPEAHFSICYTGPAQPYFDANGCVDYQFNRFGIRDRTDLTLEKPAGTTRVVCLGDSFTLGWGVRQEHNWPVLAEQELRRRWPQVQVVNCGGAGSSYADEYELALRHRHGRFQPDLVLVSLCLNDLIVTNGKLCQYRSEAMRDEELPTEERRWWMASAVLADLVRASAQRHALDLDPGRDWVGELMQLPADHPWYTQKSETPDCYWVKGTPQRALRGVRDWCRDHGARAAVVVWPLLQGTGDGQFYPFTRLHGLVVEFCKAEGLPCLDLLPTLRGQPAESLWVSPADMHPNERAQLLVAPTLAAFMADALGLQ